MILWYKKITILFWGSLVDVTWNLVVPCCNFISKLFSSIGSMSWWNAGIFQDFYHWFSVFFILVPFKENIPKHQRNWNEFAVIQTIFFLFLVWNVLGEHKSKHEPIFEHTLASALLIPVEWFKQYLAWLTVMLLTYMIITLAVRRKYIAWAELIINLPPRASSHQ